MEFTLVRKGPNSLLDSRARGWYFPRPMHTRIRRALPALDLSGNPVAPVSRPSSNAPAAPARPHTLSAHGEVREDPWFWLRDREDPATIEYLTAENAYTEQQMAPTAPLQDQLYREMLGRIQETDLSVPERDGGWLSYVRTEEGKQYPIHCRRRESMEAVEEILLDENQLALGHEYFRLAACEVSPDHTRLAFAADYSGSEEFLLSVKDLATGELVGAPVSGMSGNLAWAADSATLFYTTLDEAHRPHRLYRHVVGEAPETAVLVYEELDGAFFASINLSRSRRFLFLDLGSHTTSETRFLRADDPTGAFQAVRLRTPGVEYEVAEHEDSFYLVTNDNARNFRLMQVPIVDPGTAEWREILAERADVKLDDVDAFSRHLVVYEREGGFRQVRIIEVASGEQHRVAFPEPVYTIRRNANPEYDTSVLRFTYTSLVTPASVIDYDMDTRRWEIRKQQPVRGGYDPAQYRSERVVALTQDGTPVPVSLVWKEPLVRDGRRPMLLIGYGAYGSSYDPQFSSNTLSLLDRGFIVGFAHVRGGEEFGRAWYEAGKLANKRNTFTDFIAVAEHLVREGWTSRDRLAINGGSAGGLLMGAVTNMRPDHFAAVVAEVPFVDVVNTMLDASLPLTVIEYDEWGNPEIEQDYRTILEYSPYDNVRAQPYPAMLVTAGLHDPRVQYWEPAKWVAKLRATKTDTNPLLLRTNMEAGHAGASGRYDYLREVAFKYAFILDVLGMDGEVGER